MFGWFKPKIGVDNTEYVKMATSGLAWSHFQFGSRRLGCHDDTSDDDWMVCVDKGKLEDLISRLRANGFAKVSDSYSDSDLVAWRRAAPKICPKLPTHYLA